MRKQTLYGVEARTKIFEGVKKICAAIKVTLGPLGRNVLISQSMVVDYGVHSLPIHVTKDGYTTAKGFDLDDPHEKAGVLLVKEACQKTVDQAGDGTTTTAVLLEAIVEEGIRLINEGVNPMELKRTIDKEVELVVEGLKGMAVQIGNDNEKIFHIATISANNDIVIGRLIADAFKKIGHEGVIDIEAGKSVNTEIKIASGYRFDRSWVSPLFINNKAKQICEYEEPLILLYDKILKHSTQFERALTIAIQRGKPLVIICEDAVEEGLATLAVNAFNGKLKVCVVRAPAYGEARNDEMEDMAILTGATYMSDRRGLDLKEIEFENLGVAKKIIVTKEETIIIEGDADKDALENLLNELRMNLAEAKNEDEKFPIEKRIAKLLGGVAVIQVGAATETEMKERMDRFDDSVRAVKSALSEGFVPGSGLSFIRASKSIGEQSILRTILGKPMKQICLNAGVDAEALYLMVREGGENVGYNAKTGAIEDLIKGGVIDPAKVLRCSLQNAASSACMILTTEALIADTL